MYAVRHRVDCRMQAQPEEIMMKQRVSMIILTILLALGWTLPALAQGGTTYAVQAGDTLGDIALAYDVSVQEIMDTNGLSSPDMIFVGQTLTIPGTAAAVTASSTGYYTVQPGDTLYDVAVKFNTSVQTLATTNNLSDVDTIYTGQVLRVPGGAVAPSVSGANSCTTQYTVQWGDTLSTIAWQNGVSANTLASANNLFSDTIFAGQQLCIPGGTATPTASDTRYTVQAGDTVINIAYRYGVSQWDIVQANNLSDAGFIYVGQTLTIPGTAAAQTTPASPAAATVTATATPAAPAYVAPGAPEYQDISQMWDGSVTVVESVNKWVGAQTANFPDPDGNTTIMVRTIGALDVPVILKQGGTEIRLVTANSSEFGWATMGMKGLSPGDWQVWVDRDESDVVTARVDAGQRILVEFTFENVTQDPPPRSPTGW